jgi:hypothetical protein
MIHENVLHSQSYACIQLHRYNRETPKKKDCKMKEVTCMEEKEYLKELFNLGCVLRGKIKYLEQIKEYIIQEYVEKELVKLINSTCEKEEIYIITETQWEEYQKLKERENWLVGAGFP